jgi:small subunit ribosomal protein S1
MTDELKKETLQNDEESTNQQSQTAEVSENAASESTLVETSDETVVETPEVAVEHTETPESTETTQATELEAETTPNDTLADQPEVTEVATETAPATDDAPAAEPITADDVAAEEIAETVVAETESQEIQQSDAPETTEVHYEIKSYTGEISERVYTLAELQEASEDYTDDEYHTLVNMYEGTLTSFSEKEIVKGRVVSFDEKYVIVDIGFKSEGIVPLNEFRNVDQLKPGDEIEVFLDKVEDREGQLVLSRRKADTLRVWQKIEESFTNQAVIEGYIKRRIKGGMVVDVFGIDAFLPGSQIDVRPVRDFDAYVGKTMEFMVVKLNMASENVVVSHRALVETDLEGQREEILATMEGGQILEGTVKNITDFGVFIDLGGVDGLLHITDLSWGRVEHPSEIVKLDQRLNVVVLEFDQERKRISLGLKQLQPHPWEEIDAKYPEGAKVQGKVVSIADYGAFIELEKGVEGLIHISEMSWTQHIKHPSQLVDKNQVIECVVLNINKNEKKVSLGVKQLENDPWKELEMRYPIGSKHKGVVRNLTNFGIFIELEPGIDGLVHVSDLSWTAKVNHPSEVVNKGDELDVVILSIDFENRRISLGHKQISANPWEQYSQAYYPGAKVEDAKVVKVTDRGMFVKLPLGVEAFMPGKEAKIETLSASYKDGESLNVAVLEFDENSRNIVVSEKAFDVEDDGKAAKKAGRGKKAEPVSGAMTVGEMSGLADLKAKLEKQEATDAPVATEPQADEAPAPAPAPKAKSSKKKTEAEEDAKDSE